MKEQKIIKAWNHFNPTEEEHSAILSKIRSRARERKSRHGGSASMLLTAAAVLCIVFAFAVLSPQQSGNYFTAQAYAAGGAGSTLSQGDLLEQRDVLGGMMKDGRLHLSIALRFEGENIDRVVFSAKSGSFSEQRIDAAPNEHDAHSELYLGADERLSVYGASFETLGESITVRSTDELRSRLLFWTSPQGMTIEELLHTPIEIVATAVFRDGSTQEVPLQIDAGTEKAVIFSVTEGDEVTTLITGDPEE